MLNFVAGTDLSIEVVFEIGGETVVPDLASVSYTLRDNSGNPIAGQTDVAVTTDENTTNISVASPRAVNAKTLSYEHRTVSVQFKADGQTCFIDKLYRLIDRIPMAVDNFSVRSLIGFSANELPDEDIDLPLGYYLAADDIGKTALDAALIAGSAVTQAANRAIACRALLDVIPSLQMRAFSSEKSQTASAARLATVDLDKLERWITGLYSKAKLTVTGDTQGSLPLLELVTPVDALTGA